MFITIASMKWIGWRSQGTVLFAKEFTLQDEQTDGHAAERTADLAAERKSIFACLHAAHMVGLLVGWLAGMLVGWLLGWLVLEIFGLKNGFLIQAAVSLAKRRRW